MKTKLLFIICLFAISLKSKGQFIDIGESVPFGCPSVCAGGTIVFKIFHVENLPIGAPVQANLSSPSGSFTVGNTLINSNRYSTVSASGPWTNGSYTFNGNVTDLYFEITIPANAVPSNTYNIKFRSAVSPFTQGNSLNLPGGGTCSGLSVTPSYNPLAPVSPSTVGAGEWVAHGYTWTPTTGSPLTTPALIQQQTFFGSNNYKGHFLKSSLNFDLNFTGPSGNGKMPGPVGTINDGTSFQCGDGYTVNYSIRMLRNENFLPGYYRFSLGADDGARLSIDGGATWLIDLFTEHAYATQNTDAQFPNGVCLNGPAQLVIEYFQRPVDARLTFSVTALSSAITQPQNQSVCEGNNTSFTVGGTIPSAQYQWQISTDGGANFSAVQNSSIYSGANSSTLQLTNVPSSLSNAQYQCIITGLCGNAYSSNAAILTINPSLAIINQPSSQVVCNGDTITFEVTANGNANYQWYLSTGSGFVTALTNSSLYSNVTTSTLTINGAQPNMNNYYYRCEISGCGPAVTSDSASLTFSKPSILAQPTSQGICGSGNLKLTVNANNANTFQWQVSFDQGTSFSSISDDLVYTNTTSPELSIVVSSELFNGYIYRCIVQGCGQTIFSDTARVSISEKATDDFVPNIFTPNNDGINDFFQLRDKGLIKLSGTVYNRWGQEVYNWSGSNAKWDGKDNNDGVYFYLINATSACDGTIYEKKGSITLVR